ncbi:MAG: arginase family protein [Pseudomonadota bacterium]
MKNAWLLTPYYFESAEEALSAVVPEGTPTNGPHNLSDRNPESMALLHRPIAEFTENAAAKGDRPISIAGDCCGSIPVLAGLLRAGQTPTLVWIDAHGDFNTPETSPSQFLGGMPLAMMVGRGPQDMCETVGLRPLPEDRVWAVDLRDLDPLEREAIDASALRRTGMAGLTSLKIDGPVYVHIDMDVLNADEVGAFNYPVPGGPSVAETVAACQAFAAANQITALSVSGWTGVLDTDGKTADACGKVLDALLS